MARILIADDDPKIRKLIERVLVLDGYEIEAVDNGRQAIERINRATFDAILLDFMMPIASGFDVLAWIEKNRPDMAKTCVIILTAAIRDLAKFDTSSVYAAIPKPFDISELRDVVRKCIGDSVRATT